MDAFKAVSLATLFTQMMASDLHYKELISGGGMEELVDEVMNTISDAKIEKDFFSRHSSPAMNLVKNGIGTSIRKRRMDDKSGAMEHVSLPMYMMPQAPLVVPMQTYFEKVIHDHPSIGKIKSLIKADEKRWEKRERKISSHSSDTDGSLTEEMESADINSVDYYDNDSSLDSSDFN